MGAIGRRSSLPSSTDLIWCPGCVYKAVYVAIRAASLLHSGCSGRAVGSRSLRPPLLLPLAGRAPAPSSTSPAVRIASRFTAVIATALRCASSSCTTRGAARARRPSRQYFLVAGGDEADVGCPPVGIATRFGVDAAMSMWLA